MLCSMLSNNRISIIIKFLNNFVDCCARLNSQFKKKILCRQVYFETTDKIV